MLLAYGEGRQQISAGQVRAAVIDTPAARQSWRGEWRYPPLIASALNALH
jgi:hypothetical protein